MSTLIFPCEKFTNSTGTANYNAHYFIENNPADTMQLNLNHSFTNIQIYYTLLKERVYLTPSTTITISNLSFIYDTENMANDNEIFECIFNDSNASKYSFNAYCHNERLLHICTNFPRNSTVYFNPYYFDIYNSDIEAILYGNNNIYLPEQYFTVNYDSNFSDIRILNIDILNPPDNIDLGIGFMYKVYYSNSITTFRQNHYIYTYRNYTFFDQSELIQYPIKKIYSTNSEISITPFLTLPENYYLRSYVLENGPNGISINSSTGELTGTLQETNYNGIIDIKVLLEYKTSINIVNPNTGDIIDTINPPYLAGVIVNHKLPIIVNMEGKIPLNNIPQIKNNIYRFISLDV